MNDVTSAFIILYVFAYGLALGPIVMVYVSEILPDKGISISTVTLWSFSVCVA